MEYSIIHLKHFQLSLHFQLYVMEVYFQFIKVHLQLYLLVVFLDCFYFLLQLSSKSYSIRVFFFNYNNRLIYLLFNLILPIWVNHCETNNITLRYFIKFNQYFHFIVQLVWLIYFFHIFNIIIYKL